jgi:hypothetical protein
MLRGFVGALSILPFLLICSEFDLSLNLCDEQRANAGDLARPET